MPFYQEGGSTGFATKKKRQGKHKTRSNGTKDHNTLPTTLVLASPPKEAQMQYKCRVHMQSKCTMLNTTWTLMRTKDLVNIAMHEEAW